MNLSNVGFPLPTQEPGKGTLNDCGSQSSVIRIGLLPSFAWLTAENHNDSKPIASAARMVTRTNLLPVMNSSFVIGHYASLLFRAILSFVTAHSVKRVHLSIPSFTVNF